MSISDEQKEELIDFLVDKWVDSVDQSELIECYQDTTRVELKNSSDEDLRSHAKAYGFTYDAVTCKTCGHIHVENYDHLNGCNKCAASFEQDEEWYSYTEVSKLDT